MVCCNGWGCRETVPGADVEKSAPKDDKQEGEPAYEEHMGGSKSMTEHKGQGDGPAVETKAGNH